MKHLSMSMFDKNRVVEVCTVDGETYTAGDIYTITPFYYTTTELHGFFVDRVERLNPCMSGVTMRTIIFIEHVVSITVAPDGDADFVKEG